MGFNYGQYLSTPEYQSQILSQLMASRAKKKALNDVLGLWDRYMVAAVARHEQQKTANAAATTRRRSTQQLAQYQQQGVNIWRGANQEYEGLDFPLPNEIYDQPMIQMLRQAYTVDLQARPNCPRTSLDHFQSRMAE